jgi:hypothetical protein
MTRCPYYSGNDCRDDPCPFCDQWCGEQSDESDKSEEEALETVP